MTDEQDKASLEGKGWDILAGGEGRAKEAGGDDPFDAGATPGGSDNPFNEPVGASLTTGGENPFDEGATDEAMMDSGHGAAGSESPAEAYGDWGRGGERPDPVPTPGAAGQPEPRDLKPEDLGYGAASSGGSTLGATMESGDEMFGGMDSGSEEAPPRLITPIGQQGGTVLSEGVNVTTAEGRPLSEVSMEPGQPSRFAANAEPVIDAHFEVYDPFAPAGEPPSYAPSEGELAVDTTLGQVLITPERIDDLWNEINDTYDLVINDVRGHFQSTDQLLGDLKKAREMLLSGMDNYDNAEVFVKRVKARLQLEDKVRVWSRTIGTWIAVYLIAWLVTLMLLVMIQAPVVDTFSSLMPLDMALAYVPALWGALGAALGGLWVLIEHTAKKRNFDPIHTRWYVLNPFMGMGLGVVVYALFQMGVVVGGAGTGQAVPDAGIQADSTPWLLYGICLVVGFQQNVVWDLLNRVLSLMRVGDDSSDDHHEKTAEDGLGLELDEM